MAKAHHPPQLMPEKLLLIREYLNVSQSVMAELLELSKTRCISVYENGVREPDLVVTLAYSRLGKVSMASVVDDEISVAAFRKQLGTFDRKSLRSSQRKIKNVKADGKKP